MGRQELKALGKRVRHLRIARTWIQEDVARLAGVSPKSVSNIESGTKVRPATLRAVVGVFGEDGVEALREFGFDDWADVVADDVETRRIGEAIGQHLEAVPQANELPDDLTLEDVFRYAVEHATEIKRWRKKST